MSRQRGCDIALWNMWVTGSETLDIGLCEAVWVSVGSVGVTSLYGTCG